MSKRNTPEDHDNPKNFPAKDTVKPLTKTEKAALEKYEKEVDEHKASFIAMAVALSLIQKKKLYRGQGTFAEYCEARFDIKRAYAYKLIRAGEIQDELKELGAPEVSNESQARLLGTIISKEERAEVMGKAAELAGDGKVILAEHISAAINEVAPELKPKRQSGGNSVKKVANSEIQKWLEKIIALHEEFVNEYEDSDAEIATLAELRAEIEAALGVNPDENSIIDVKAEVSKGRRSENDPDESEEEAGDSDSDEHKGGEGSDLKDAA